MALHIRDFRQSDAAGLARLGETGYLLGALPPRETGLRILTGLRDGQLAGAIWLSLDGETGIIPAILVAHTAGWQSDVRELAAEASLWLASRGAARIELRIISRDKDLLAGLLDMQFKADDCAGIMQRDIAQRRLNPASDQAPATPLTAIASAIPLHTRPADSGKRAARASAGESQPQA